MIIAFITAFFLSFVGSMPPGLINLTVTMVSAQRGLRSALPVALGASAVEWGQAFIALAFSQWLNQIPGFRYWLHVVALPLFVILAVYHLFFAKTSHELPVRKDFETGRGLLRGVVVSSLNVLAIPYWLFYGLLLEGKGWLTPQGVQLWIFCTGVGLGTFLLLYLYARLGRFALERMSKLNRYLNKVVGGIFALLALLEFWQVVK